MVDRYRCYGWDTRRGDMRREDDGNFVSYSDYAKLEAQLVELEAENKWQAASIEILRRHAFHWKDRAVAAESLKDMLRTAKELRDNANGDCNAIQQAIYWEQKAAALEPAAPEGQKPVAYRVHAPEDEHYGTGPDRLQFHSLSQYDLDNGYRQTPLYTHPPYQAVTEAMVEAALNVYCVFPRIDRGPIGISTRRKVMHRALKAAMEAGR